MSNVVHVDEKWFYVHKVSSTFILSLDEQPPHLSCPSKRFIAKVMFLAAVARPRYDYDRKRGFDGKIGIFPIIEHRAAQRTTQNQKKGDVIMVPLTVDKNVYSNLLKTKVIPAIKATWPGMYTHVIHFPASVLSATNAVFNAGVRNRTLWIQQDNASPHVHGEAAALEASVDGWDIRVRRQPAMSPDMNVLDLGFFNAIQAVQHKKQAYSIPDLVKAVQEAYDQMEVRTLEKCFLTLQAVMEQTMLAGGGNEYALPRVKSVHFPSGIFPAALTCSDYAYFKAIDTLESADKQ